MLEETRKPFYLKETFFLQLSVAWSTLWTHSFIRNSSISLFLYTSFLLNVLEPFNVSNPDNDLLFALLQCGYGVASSIFLYAFCMCIRKQIQDFACYLRSFAIVGLVAFFGLVAFTVSLAAVNWGYAYCLHWLFDGYNSFSFPMQTYIGIALKTFYIMVSWSSVLLLVIMHSSHKKYKNVERVTRETKQLNEIVHFVSDVQKDSFSVGIDELLSLKCEGNYINLRYLTSCKEVKSRLIRLSMRKAQKALPNGLFVRSHQSHILNLRYLKKLVRKGGTVFAVIDWVDEPIPISRANMSFFREQMQTRSLLEITEYHKELELR